MCGGFVNNQIKNGLLLSLRVKKIISLNIWQSYQQERDCLVHFLRLLAVSWPGAQDARDNYALACSFAKYSPILKLFFTLTLCNKPFLIWLLTTPPHLKYVATLRCNLSLKACFAYINVSQGRPSVATCVRCGGFLYICSTANLDRNLPVKIF